MLLLKILGVAAVLLLLLCMVPLRIQLTASGREMTVEAGAGRLRFRVYPRKKRPEPEEETEPEPEKPEKEGGRRFSPTRADLLDALRTLPGPVKRSLLRIGRGVRVHPLTLSWRIGGREDPAEAARRYGYASAALWAWMPLAEKAVRIPEPSVHFDVDFDAPSDTLRGEAGVSVRIGVLLSALLMTAFPAAKWLLRTFRRNRAAGKQAAEP